MAIGNVGASNPLSSLWIKPHYGPESKIDKYRREHSMEAKQEELAKFQTQTTATMEQSKGVASNDPYTGAARTRSLTAQGLNMSMMFEVQRTSVKNFEDMKTQIEQNARESQTQQTQDMAASVQVSEPETEVDGTSDEASGNDVSASTADTSKSSISQSGGNSGETNSNSTTSSPSSPTYTSGGVRAASSAAVYGKVNISV